MVVNWYDAGLKKTVTTVPKVYRIGNYVDVIEQF